MASKISTVSADRALLELLPLEGPPVQVMTVEEAEKVEKGLQEKAYRTCLALKITACCLLPLSCSVCCCCARDCRLDELSPPTGRFDLARRALDPICCFRYEDTEYYLPPQDQKILEQARQILGRISQRSKQVPSESWDYDPMPNLNGGID